MPQLNLHIYFATVNFYSNTSYCDWHPKNTHTMFRFYPIFSFYLLVGGAFTVSFDAFNRIYYISRKCRPILVGLKLVVYLRYDNFIDYAKFFFLYSIKQVTHWPAYTVMRPYVVLFQTACLMRFDTLGSRKFTLKNISRSVYFSWILQTFQRIMLWPIGTVYCDESHRKVLQVIASKALTQNSSLFH